MGKVNGLPDKTNINPTVNELSNIFWREAGAKGIIPEFVPYAERVGYISPSGLSKDHLKNTYLSGLSIFYPRSDKAKVPTDIYIEYAKIKNIPIYVLSGWWLGEYGSDGELLLVDFNIVGGPFYVTNWYGKEIRLIGNEKAGD